MSACPVDTVSAPVSSHSSGREFAVLWPLAKPRGLSLMVWYLMVVRSVAHHPLVYARICKESAACDASGPLYCVRLLAASKARWDEDEDPTSESIGRHIHALIHASVAAPHSSCLLPLPRPGCQVPIQHRYGTS